MQMHRSVISNIIMPFQALGLNGIKSNDPYMRDIGTKHLDTIGREILNRLYALGSMDNNSLTKLADWVAAESARRAISPVELYGTLDKLIKEAGIKDISSITPSNIESNNPVITRLLADVIKSTEHPITLRKRIGERRLKEYQTELYKLMEEAKRHPDDIKLYNELAIMRQSGYASLNEIIKLEERLEKDGTLERVGKLVDKMTRLLSEYKDVEEALGVAPLNTSDPAAIIGKRLGVISAALEEKESALREAYRRIYSTAATKHRFGLDIPLEEYLEDRIIQGLEYGFEDVSGDYAVNKIIDNMDPELKRTLLEREYEILTDIDKVYYSLDEVDKSINDIVSDILKEGKYPSIISPNDYQNTAIGYQKSAAEQRKLEETIKETIDTTNIQRAVSEYGEPSGGISEITRRAGTVASKYDQSYNVVSKGKIKEQGRMPTDYSDLWKEGQEIFLPKSAVPYEVVKVDAENMTAVIKPASIPLNKLTIDVEVDREAVKALRKYAKYSEKAAHAKEVAGGIDKIKDSAVGLITGEGVKLTSPDSLVKLILNGPEDALNDKRLKEELQKVALSVAPWAEKSLPADELVTASYEALLDAISNRGVSGFDFEQLGKLLKEDEAFQGAFKGALVSHIFEAIGRDKPYSAVASIAGYIRENIRIPTASGKLRRLTDIEVARLTKDAVEQALEKNVAGVSHLAYIKNMSLNEIIKHMYETPEGATVSYEAIKWKQLEDEAEGIADEIAAAPIEHIDSNLIQSEEEALGHVFKQDEHTKRMARSIADLFGPGDTTVRHTIKLEGYDETSAKRVIDSLINIRNIAGENVRLYASYEGKPLELMRGTYGDIIAHDTLTGKRYLAGSARPIAVGLYEKPITAKLPDIYEPPEELKELYAKQEPTLTRQPGNYERLINISHDIPDSSLAALNALRNIKEGQSRVVSAFDWETTALPGTDIPFYPTEVGFITDELRKEGGKIVRQNIAAGNITFKPSEEVISAVNRISEEINNQLQSAAKVQIKRNEAEFLINIGKFADSEMLRLKEKIGKAEVIDITRESANRMLSAAQGGIAYLSERGVSLEEGMNQLIQWMRSARDRNTILIGQNMLNAEYLWSKTFAEKLSPAQSYHARRTIDSFFKQPRTDLITLDKFFAGSAIGSSIESQYSRYIEPVLKGNARVSEDVRAAIESLGLTEQSFHRASEDIRKEIAILYSHLSRELPEGADIRPLRKGDFLVRESPGRGLIGGYASAESGRLSRGVYKFRGIEQKDYGLAALLERMTLDESGKLKPSGIVEALAAPNIVELSRRIHNQFAYVPTAEKAAEAAYNIAEDYARREVAKAVESPYRLAELITWGEHGLPSLKESESAIDYNAKIIKEAAAAAGKEQLTPKDELLVNVINREKPRDISAPQPADALSLAIKPRDTAMRRQAWPQIKEWLESAEAGAYKQLLSDVARYKAVGLLPVSSSEVFKDFESKYDEFIKSEGLSYRTKVKPNLMTAGRIAVDGVDVGKLIIDTASADRTEKLTKSFVSRVAKKLKVGSDDALDRVSRELMRANIISATPATISDLSRMLYDAAKENAQGFTPVEVVLRHKPVITDEYKDRFIEYMRKNAIIPKLSLPRELQEQVAAMAPSEAVSAVDEFIAQNPIYRARQERFLQAVEGLKAKGIEPVSLFSFGDIPVMRHGLQLTAEPSLFESPEYIQTSRQIVDEILQATESLRKKNRPLFSSELKKLGLGETMNALYDRLSSEIGSPHSPTWEALGWGRPWAEGVAERNLDNALIPVFATNSLSRESRLYGNLFMRRVGDLTDDEVKLLSAVLQERGGKISEFVGAQLGAEHVRRINEAIKEAAKEKTAERQAAETIAQGIASNTARDIVQNITQTADEAVAAGAARVKGAGADEVVRETMRMQNEAVKQRALQKIASESGGGTREAFEKTVAQGGFLASALPLAAGIGLALLGTSYILRHNDRERYTSDTHPQQNRATKPVPINPGINFEEQEPYQRPAPIEEDSGYRIRVRGRSRRRLINEELAGAIGNEINGATGRNVNINIRSQDDTSSLDENFAKEVFAQLLKYGYVRK